MYRFITRRTRSQLLIIAAFSAAHIALSPSTAKGVPASPRGVEVSQPDGTKITIFMRGDEFYSWNEDAKGYTIVKDTGTGEWFYTEKSQGGSLRVSSYKVGAKDPDALGLKKHFLDDSKATKAQTVRRARKSTAAFSVSSSRVSSTPSMIPALTGTMKNLVILARFSDIAPTYSQAQFDSLFNQVGYNFDSAAGSVKDYYHEISYNRLTIQSTVSQWVTLPHGYAYYGANPPKTGIRAEEMIIDAINALDAAGFDFSTVDGNNDGEVDGLTIIHSGRGEEANEGINPDYIWAHQGELSEPVYKDGKKMQMYHTEAEDRGTDGQPATWGITRIGVIAHETGHFLGLPDLYDYGADSKGVGQFCLMSGGSWNGPPGGEGIYPAHMSAWPKAILGWATPTQLTTTGSYNLPRIEDNSTAMYWMKADAFLSSEYFLLENRQSVGFDLWIPGVTNGILIWHVDQQKLWNGNNDDQTHYLVDLEEAGGIQHLELNQDSGADEDYFRSGNKTIFGDSTIPGSKSYLGYNLGLLISSISISGNPMTFNVTTTPTSKLTMGKLKAYPNPCYFDKNQEITIKGLPPDATDAKVFIYNAAGKLVRTLTIGSGIDEDSVATWDGKDETGAKSASGFYIYLAKSGNYDPASGKFYIFW